MIHDIMAILFLIVLEGLLSFDNALALAAMVKHLPEKEQKLALWYGMAGAFLFRFLALCFVVYLMENQWVKVVGGLYLCWLTVKFFWPSGDEAEDDGKGNILRGFWMTVALVELTDIAFSIDSILAAVAVSNKVWVVVAGGIMGIIMMRFAASVFIGLMKVHPKLERSAFLLVGIVGVKLLVEASGHHLSGWLTWPLMLVALLSGLSWQQKKTVKFSGPRRSDPVDVSSFTTRSEMDTSLLGASVIATHDFSYSDSGTSFDSGGGDCGGGDSGGSCD